MIANPPYGATLTAEDKRVYRKLYPEVQFKINTYALFVLLSFALMRENGTSCYILPNTLLDNYFEDKIREKLLANKITELNDLSDKIFENAVVHSMIIRYSKNKSQCDNYVKVNTSDTLFGSHIEIPQEYFCQQPYFTFDLRTFNNDSLIAKLRLNSDRLEDVLDIRQAIKTGDDQRFITDMAIDSSYKPILRGKDVKRFSYKSPNLYVYYGRHLACPRTSDIFEQPKILIRESGAKITATIDRDNYYIMSSLYNAIPKRKDFSLEFLLGLINSELFQFIMNKLTFEKTKGAFTKAKIFHYYNLPVKKADKKQQLEVSDIVIEILKRAEEGRDYSSQEKELNEVIYKLYSLTPEEIRKVKGE